MKIHMKRSTFLFWISFFCILIKADAQDAVFSQFYASPVLLNPAFTGSTLAPRVSLNYRDQWHNIPNAFATFAASYDQFFEKINSGIGVTLMNDQQGDGIIAKNNANITYAYRLQTRNYLTLKLGVEAGIGHSSLDWSRLVFLDQIDPVNGVSGASQEIAPVSLSKTYADFGAGLVAYNKKFYVGVSLKHLNSPNINFLDKNANINTGLPTRFTFNTGYEFVYKQNRKNRPVTYVSPYLLLVRQGPFGMINVGAQGGMQGFFGGLGFRHAFRNSDAVIVNFGIQKGIFKIGYSHDITVNGLPNSWGAHELSLLLNFDELYDRSKPNYNDCFRFFR
jgi:type IX secretion system PorP/SprF family membrane protein